MPSRSADFKNEAQAAAQVQHPNIVPVFAVGEENGVHYYVMQLIEGQSLTSLLGGAANGRRTAPSRYDVAEQRAHVQQPAAASGPSDSIRSAEPH